MITSKYISQFCVIGDRRNYLTALVTLEADTVKEYAARNNIPFTTMQDLISNDRIILLIHDEIREKNRSLASFESIKKFTIVPEFTIDTDELTPTMKIRRNEIVEHYRDAIAAMYEEMTDAEITFMKERNIDRRKMPDRRASTFDLRGNGALERRIGQRRMSPVM